MLECAEVVRLLSWSCPLPAQLGTNQAHPPEGCSQEQRDHGLCCRPGMFASPPLRSHAGCARPRLPSRACCVAAEPTPEEARRLSKAQRRRQKAADERAVQQQERALAAGEQDGPQSAAQHEQAIMAQPDASIVWIQYMAFLISLGEVEKARGLAERAVQTINYRWGKSHPDLCIPEPVVMQCSGFPGDAEEAGLRLQALNYRSGWLAALHVGCLWTAQWVRSSWLLGHPPHAQELRQACIMLLVVDSHQKGMVYSGKQTTLDNSMPQAPCRQEREGCKAWLVLMVSCLERQAADFCRYGLCPTMVQARAGEV